MRTLDLGREEYDMVVVALAEVEERQRLCLWSRVCYLIAATWSESARLPSINVWTGKPSTLEIAEEL